MSQGISFLHGTDSCKARTYNIDLITYMYVITTRLIWLLRWAKYSPRVFILLHNSRVFTLTVEFQTGN